MVVNANNHPLHFRIVVTHPIGLAGVWIVGFIASEEIESLPFLAQTLYLREDIVASLDADGIGIAAPQVGKSLRLIYIDVDVLKEEMPELLASVCKEVLPYQETLSARI